MDWQRLHRAITIPIEHLSLKYCCILPLRIVATIQGNQSTPYTIIIDQEIGIYHNCPDFQRPNTICKHLGRLISYFPPSIQSDILTIYDEIGKFSLSDISLVQPEEINIEDLSCQMHSLLPFYQEDSLISLYIEQIICDWVYHYPQSALMFINNNPTFIPQFGKMLQKLPRPIPNYLETCFSDSHYRIELQNMLWELSNTLTLHDSVKFNNGLQLML